MVGRSHRDKKTSHTRSLKITKRKEREKKSKMVGEEPLRQEESSHTDTDVINRIPPSHLIGIA